MFSIYDPDIAGIYGYAHLEAKSVDRVRITTSPSMKPASRAETGKVRRFLTGD